MSIKQRVLGLLDSGLCEETVAMDEINRKQEPAPDFKVCKAAGHSGAAVVGKASDTRVDVCQKRGSGALGSMSERAQPLLSWNLVGHLGPCGVLPTVHVCFS